MVGSVDANELDTCAIQNSELQLALNELDGYAVCDSQSAGDDRSGVGTSHITDLPSTGDGNSYGRQA